MFAGSPRCEGDPAGHCIRADGARNHDAQMIGDPRSIWGVTKGNPIFTEMREAALMINPTFLCNVTLNRDKQITGVYFGDLIAAHDTGIEFARRTAMRPVPSPFDIVVTTNSGFPLDLNLYQAIKGVSAANLIVKDGGAIIPPRSVETAFRAW